MTDSFILCVNGEKFDHRIAKQDLPTEIELLSWLDSQEIFPKCYWQGRDGLEIVALGSVLKLSSIPEFNQGNDSPAHFWGGRAFSPHSSTKDSLWQDFPVYTFFLPQYELVRHENKLELITHTLNGEAQELLQILPSYFSSIKKTLKTSHQTPDREDWQKLVEDCLFEIEKQTFEKVVLARRSTHFFNSPLNAFEILSKIKAKGSIRFALQFSKSSTFIGATPERLYKREGRSLYTEAIAGTRKRGQTARDDALLEKELLESLKEKSEFNFVKRSIEESLKPLCLNLSWEIEDDVIKTPIVQHLHNALKGELIDGVSDAQILAALHPTASTGGLPRISALEHLLHNEPFERGWYGAPLGFVGQIEAEFAVGIRSALIIENALYLFAGAGVVAGSTAHKEWDELEHKTSLWRDLCKSAN